MTFPLEGRSGGGIVSIDMLQISPISSMTTPKALALAAGLLCSLAPTAYSQDSVSRNANGGNGLPGDALGAFTTTTQRVNYVVDLTPFTGSWGTPFGIAPVMKSSKVSTTRFNAVNGTSTLSQNFQTGATFPAASYTRWAAAGGGLNTAENNTALNSPVAAPTGSIATILGLAFLDFDEVAVSGINVLTNQVVGGSLAFDPAQPSRLYVQRVIGAANTIGTVNDRSQFGLGSVDAFGNVVFRADGFAVAETGTTALVGDNIFRVRLGSRDTTVNLIDNNGGSQVAATDWLVQRDASTQAVPNALPADGSNPSVLVGADFKGRLVLGTSATTSVAHRPNTLDHRASPAISSKLLFPGTVATGAILSRSSAGNGPVDSMSIFGLTASGGVSGARTITLPTTFTDPCDTFAWPLAGGDLRGYESQVTFRGGAAPVAVSQDAQGRGLVASTVYSGANGGLAAGAMNAYNAIVVGRFDPANNSSPVTWSLAAWISPTAADGKDILGDYGVDGAPGTGDLGENDGIINGNDSPIGRLASAYETTQPGFGPSLSAPAFDSAGNVYFIAMTALKRRVSSVVVEEFRPALLRAVYNPATFCYGIELLADVGKTFAGTNSARNWRIEYLALADADSISSSSLWSSSSNQRSWNNANTSALAPSAPQHLGGLVVSARILYDRNGDGQFLDPSAQGANTTSVDEGYNAVLYIGNITQPPVVGPTCDSLDFNNDGNIDPSDVDAYFSILGEGPCIGGTNCNDLDFNNDGNIDPADVDAYFSILGEGPCV
jgi:hypothetical protein